jgi:hypothetical protein
MMAKKARRAVARKSRKITKDQVISTLVYIRHLTDALIATLMDASGADFPSLPQPVLLSGGGYKKDCPPPAPVPNCPPEEPDDDGPTVLARSTNCPKYHLSGPVKLPFPTLRRRKKG